MCSLTLFLKDRTIQRRLLHVAGSSFIGYYFIPRILPYGLDKTWLLVGILSCVGILEIYRWFSKQSLSLSELLRSYEEKRPASYGYFTLGSVVLLGFFPQFITIPCILSAAVCDPIIGFLRQKNSSTHGFLIAFIISFSFFFLAWKITQVWIAILASFLGAITVLFAEHKSTLWLDDDFLMQIVPAMVLSLFTILIKISNLSLPEKLIYALW